MNAWTVFYWAWALSWSPFAGLFIARISKGRTVREVAFTGIVATSAATIPWFTVVGGTAVWSQHNGIADFGAVMAGEMGAEVSGFILFETFPLGSVFMLAFMLLVTSFFVTSADSSTLAVSMMTTGGKSQPVDAQPGILGCRSRDDCSHPHDPRRDGQREHAPAGGYHYGNAVRVRLLPRDAIADTGLRIHLRSRAFSQDETVLYGSGRDTERESSSGPGPGGPMEADDD